MDVDFVKRVYRTSVGVWLFTLLWCAALNSLPAAIGVTVGFGISLGSLMILEWLVTAVYTPDATTMRRRASWRMMGMATAKYGIISAILWATLKSGWASPVGLAIGIGLPQAVIFLKALGTVITFGPELNRRS